MYGRSLANNIIKRIKEIKSRNNEICRSIETATVRTPSRLPNSSSSASGEETATTSK